MVFTVLVKKNSTKYISKFINNQRNTAYISAIYHRYCVVILKNAWVIDDYDELLITQLRSMFGFSFNIKCQGSCFFLC